MKHLKLGFASIIAILAISATIAAQAGAFETKRAQIANCFIPTTTIDYKASCNATTLTDFAVLESCSAADVTNAPLTHIFGGLSNTNKIADNLVSAQCPGLANVVCCVFIESDPSPCALPNAVQPTFALNSLPADEYRIVSVRCKQQ